MTDKDNLYQSWIIEDSYFNLMLDCGEKYNQWVQNALEYLPQAVLEENKDKLVFISTAERDGCRIARQYCENREVILLSERILPKRGARETDPEVRYFIFSVLHEVVHAVKRHKSPKLDKLTLKESQAQEDEADKIAMEWFNKHVKSLDNPYIKYISINEIKETRQKNRERMENLYDEPVEGISDGRS